LYWENIPIDINHGIVASLQMFDRLGYSFDGVEMVMIDEQVRQSTQVRQVCFFVEFILSAVESCQVSRDVIYVTINAITPYDQCMQVVVAAPIWNRAAEIVSIQLQYHYTRR
jgi:hypothetical protein